MNVKRRCSGKQTKHRKMFYIELTDPETFPASTYLKYITQLAKAFSWDLITLTINYYFKYAK